MNRLWQIENYRSMKITSDENRKQLISDCRGYCKIPVDERENEFYGKIILKGGSLKHFHGQGQGWLETLSLGIGINFIFSAWNQNQLKILESESIYSFDRNLIMAWIRNQFHFCALESESISFFALESESNYRLGESVLGPPGGPYHNHGAALVQLRVTTNGFCFPWVSSHTLYQLWIPVESRSSSKLRI